MSSVIEHFDENVVKSFSDAMHLFRKSDKKKAYYYVVDLKKTIKFNILRICVNN